MLHFSAAVEQHGLSAALPGSFRASLYALKVFAGYEVAIRSVHDIYLSYQILLISLVVYHYDCQSLAFFMSSLLGLIYLRAVTMFVAPGL